MTFLVSLFNLLKPLIELFFRKNINNQNYWSEDLEQSRIQEIEKITILDEISKTNQLYPPRFCHPVVKFPIKITSPFGYRKMTVNGESFMQNHIGVDYSTVGNNAVVAPENIIIQSILQPDLQYPSIFQWSNGRWQTITVPNGRGWTPFIIAIGKFTGNIYKFYHVNPNCQPEQWKTMGQEIARTGQWGYCQGEHLHFEIWPKFENEVMSKITGKMTFWPEPIDGHKYLENKLHWVG